MPEARDRLSRRQDDPSILFLRQRSQFGSLQILPDVPAVNTFRWGATPLNGATTGVAGSPGRGGGVGRGTFGTPRLGNGRGRVSSGRENTPARSARRTPRGGGGNRSILPSWYPRKPLQDITPIVKAIERRRARLREVEGLQLSSPLPQGQSVYSPSVPVIGAPLEHKFSMISPSPTTRIRHCPPTIGKVPKILLDITKQSDGPSDFLTPEKKLLNSIEKIEKVVTQELNRLKRTPAAKRAEREKKVRTLMSMR
ncbi:Uv-b-insensitive 4 [Heracleum sosnowskyi]|uniref:Uv-b-insensitive 4 n=1 Tax=Heracleum sosnowskyi TaxID=360622 RepID=A0AAD8HNG7_9APIA|nr:Uv-b-insensitive 4 [Heracleum sosnowskyi]